MDGSLLNLPHLRAKTNKTIKRNILEALFADDCTIMVHKESHFQLIVNKLAEALQLLFSSSVLPKLRSCCNLPQTPLHVPNQSPLMEKS